jgi:hypothetical protein
MEKEAQGEGGNFDAKALTFASEGLTADEHDHCGPRFGCIELICTDDAAVTSSVGKSSSVRLSCRAVTDDLNSLSGQAVLRTSAARQYRVL